MFKKLPVICGVLSILLSVTSTVFAQEKVMVDKIVAVVGNSAIFYSDVYSGSQQIEAQRKKDGVTSDRSAMSESLEKLLFQKLLYNQAQLDSVRVNTSGIIASVEARIEQMIQEAGSIPALEAQYGKPIFDIRSAERANAEETSYVQMMQYEVTSNVKITPGEVERFYKKINKNELPIIPEQYVYAQIVKYPSSTKEAKQRARENLLEMRERINNGTRFDLLARMYSVDNGTAMKGGEMDYMPLDGFVKPFADALAKLQPGQVSEIVETEFGFHIIQLIDKKGKLYKCRHILLKPTFTDSELLEGGIFLDSLAKVIRNDSITFEKAALKYSEDKYSKQNGGVVTNHELLEFYGANDTSYSTTKFYKEELRNEYAMIRNLKQGDVSDSYQAQDLRGNMLSKIIKLIEIIPAHTASMKDDYLRLEELALAQKQSEVFEKWLDKKIDAMYIRIEPDFRYDDFMNKKWIK